MEASQFDKVHVLVHAYWKIETIKRSNKETEYMFKNR